MTNQWSYRHIREEPNCLHVLKNAGLEDQILLGFSGHRNVCSFEWLGGSPFEPESRLVFKSDRENWHLLQFLPPGFFSGMAGFPYMLKPVDICLWLDRIGFLDRTRYLCLKLSRPS